MKSTFRLPGFTAIAFSPGVAILAPLFLQFTSFGIVNTYWAMIILDLLFALPLTVYLLVAYFQELPADLEQAAKVDGCTTWQAFWKVTVPLSLPGVITTGILTFIYAWSEFLFANTFAFDQTTQRRRWSSPTLRPSSRPITAPRRPGPSRSRSRLFCWS